MAILSDVKAAVGEGTSVGIKMNGDDFMVLVAIAAVDHDAFDRVD